jgi:hypothetical protein
MQPLNPGPRKRTVKKVGEPKKQRGVLRVFHRIHTLIIIVPNIFKILKIV